jgi:hypothetical protein
MSKRILEPPVIGQLRRKLNAKLKAATERHKEELQKIDGEMAALERLCPHPQLGYSPDPSGGRDGNWVCRDCGYYGTRNPTKKQSGF